LDGPQSDSLGLSYLHDNWPRTKLDRAKDMTQPTQFGWTKVDDWFNGHWKRAKTTIESLPDGWLRISFEPLSSEFPEETGYDVRFRRTLGLRIEGVKPDSPRRIRVLTRSAKARTTLRVELNAGASTPVGGIGWDGYNAQVRDVHAIRYCQNEGGLIRWEG